MRRAPLFFFSIVFIAVAAVACSGIDISSAAPTPYGYEIDPIFWAFYKQNGGRDVLGPVLTTIFSNASGQNLQYVDSGLLVYDPSENQISFAPLGIEQNLGEPPEERQTQSGDLVLNGYLVHPALVDFYLDLGRELVGAPISNPDYNYGKNRLEQHFENLGLYYLLDDPQKTPHLLAYGLLDCGSSCEGFSNNPGDGTVDPIITDEDFRNFINTFPIPTDLLGDAVSRSLLLNNDSTQMIFANMVLTSFNGQIAILNTPQYLGFGSSNLFPEIRNPNLVFVPTQDSLGHNVFLQFHNFILANGGYVVSGYPTTEIFTYSLENNVIRQCFTHLCLDYYPDALEAKVRPAQLGPDYFLQIRDMIIDRPDDGYMDEDFTVVIRNALFTINIEESYSSINSTTPQIITVIVRSENVSQPNQILTLYITLPDGREVSYNLPPTNQNGETGITLPPIAAENGTFVEYRVCLAIADHDSICALDGFLIWGNP